MFNIAITKYNRALLVFPNNLKSNSKIGKIFAFPKLEEKLIILDLMYLPFNRKKK